MKSFIAFLIMVVWSAFIYIVMNLVGFTDYVPNMGGHESTLAYLGYNFGAAVMLLIGLIGNVWIYFLVVGEQPWQWGGKKN